MKICHVNYSDSGGGAAIAAMRLNSGLLARGADSRFLAAEKRTTLSTVTEIASPWKHRQLHFFQHLTAGLARLQLSRNLMPHSFGCFDTGLGEKIIGMAANIVNLHWVNGEMMSLREIAAIAAAKNTVWTFHDAWPLCGAEHHCLVGGKERYRHGYTRDNAEDPGFDWDRRIWMAKRKYWTGMPLHIVTPSRWLAEQVRNSILFRDTPVTVIPNGLDLQELCSSNREQSRETLGLPAGKTLIGFGATNLDDINKGGHELRECLARLHEDNKNFELVVVGDGDISGDISLKINCLGKLDEPREMADFYRACDVFVLASKQDNLPNMIMEAMACGTPCAAFNVGGIPEMIVHQENGYLAKTFDPEDLAAGIKWIIINNNHEIGIAARHAAVNKFDILRTAEAYLTLYRQMMK